MKPRNKREREVAELSSKLPPLTKQEEWAIENIFRKDAYKCKNELWCSHCAHTWINIQDSELSLTVLGANCPHCNSELTVTNSRKQKNEEVNYITIVTVCGEYQVFRHIYCYKFTRKREAFLHHFFSEVVQEWITKDGKRTIMAKPMTQSGNGWLYGNELSIKNEYNRGYYGYGSDNYSLYGEIYPEIELLPILHKYGLRNSFYQISPSKLIRNLLNGGDYELCLKTKQYSMLQHLHGTGHANIKYKPSFNICNRNKYKIKDAAMWVDYLDLLSYFGKDLRNAKYVCPKDLNKAHDVLMKKKQKIDTENALQREREEAIKEAIENKKDISKFYREKMKFFGIEIKDGDITIRPLESVTQFYQEAKVMHHCVFSNRYYSKENSLVLSAHIGDKKIETIEINLRTLEIVQSRAVCNKESEYHNQIIKLVKKNMNLISQRMTA